MIDVLINEVLENLPEDYSKEEVSAMKYDDICDYIFDYFESVYLETVADNVYYELLHNLDNYFKEE